MRPEVELQRERFMSKCTDGVELFSVKNESYGNAFEVYGVLGVVCEILGAVARLPQLVLWSPGHGNEFKNELIDILTDVHNFANMALICIDKDNWDGRHRE